MTGIHINTKEYEVSHGKLPGQIRPGYGVWAFRIGSEVLTSTSSRYSLALADAKRIALSRGVTEIVVLP